MPLPFLSLLPIVRKFNEESEAKMKASQYKRLSFVLIVPLIVSGYFIYSKIPEPEVHQIECKKIEQREGFICFASGFRKVDNDIPSRATVISVGEPKYLFIRNAFVSGDFKINARQEEGGGI